MKMAYYLVAFLKTSLKVFEYYKRVMYGGVFKNVTIDLKQQRYSNVFEHRKKNHCDRQFLSTTAFYKHHLNPYFLWCMSNKTNNALNSRFLFLILIT